MTIQKNQRWSASLPEQVDENILHQLKDINGKEKEQYLINFLTLIS